MVQFAHILRRSFIKVKFAMKIELYVHLETHGTKNYLHFRTSLTANFQLACSCSNFAF